MGHRKTNKTKHESGRESVGKKTGFDRRRRIWRDDGEDENEHSAGIINMYVWNCQGVKKETKQRKKYYPRRKVCQHSAMKDRGEYQKNTTQNAPRGCWWEGQQWRWQNSCNSSVCPPPSSLFYSLAFLPFTPALSLPADVICPADVVTCELPRLVPTLLSCPSPTLLPWTQGSWKGSQGWRSPGAQGRKNPEYTWQPEAEESSFDSWKSKYLFHRS